LPRHPRAPLCHLNLDLQQPPGRGAWVGRDLGHAGAPTSPSLVGLAPRGSTPKAAGHGPPRGQAHLRLIDWTEGGSWAGRDGLGKRSFQPAAGGPVRSGSARLKKQRGATRSPPRRTGAETQTRRSARSRSQRRWRPPSWGARGRPSSAGLQVLVGDERRAPPAELGLRPSTLHGMRAPRSSARCRSGNDVGQSRDDDRAPSARCRSRSRGFVESCSGGPPTSPLCLIGGPMTRWTLPNCDASAPDPEAREAGMGQVVISAPAPASSAATMTTRPANSAREAQPDHAGAGDASGEELGGCPRPPG